MCDLVSIATGSYVKDHFGADPFLAVALRKNFTVLANQLSLTQCSESGGTRPPA